MFERSWVEISLVIIRKKFEIYKNCLLGDNVHIMPVVKADAYGHGDVEAAKVFQDAGAQEFAVSNIKQGLLVRSVWINS